MIDWDRRYAARARGMVASEIRELLKLLDQPDIISFAGGIPDPALFPVQAIESAHRRILGDPARAAVALQYSPSEGYRPLRQWIADYMTTLAAPCTAEHILITSGSQQALDFIAKLFIGAGDTVLVARPTYLGALQAMSAYEPSYAPLPRRGDNHPMTSSLGTGRLALAYVMPSFANPTGTSLDVADRAALLEATAALDVPVVEEHAAADRPIETDQRRHQR